MLVLICVQWPTPPTPPGPPPTVPPTPRLCWERQQSLRVCRPPLIFIGAISFVDCVADWVGWESLEPKGCLLIAMLSYLGVCVCVYRWGGGALVDRRVCSFFFVAFSTPLVFPLSRLRCDSTIWEKKQPSHLKKLAAFFFPALSS